MTSLNVDDNKILCSNAIEVYYDNKLHTYVLEFKDSRKGKCIISDDIISVLIPEEVLTCG